MDKAKTVTIEEARKIEARLHLPIVASLAIHGTVTITVGDKSYTFTLANGSTK